MREWKDGMSPKMLRWSGWILLVSAAISIVGTALGFLICGPAGLSGPPATVVSILMLTRGVLLGLRIIQTRVYASLTGWLLIVAVVLSAVGFPLEGTMSAIVQTVSSVLLFVALGWLGYVIASLPVEVATQSAS